VRGVLDRLLADEGPHARVGVWFFDWAAEQLEDAERARLAELAADAIAAYAPLWQATPCETCPLPRGLAGHDEIAKQALRTAVQQAIVTPLSRYGIVLPPERIAQLS
jgi:hypothetical protein